MCNLDFIKMADNVSEDEEVQIHMTEKPQSPQENVDELKDELQFALLQADDMKKREETMRRRVVDTEREKEIIEGRAQHQLLDKNEEIRHLKDELAKLTTAGPAGHTGTSPNLNQFPVRGASCSPQNRMTGPFGHQVVPSMFSPHPVNNNNPRERRGYTIPSPITLMRSVATPKYV